MGAVSRKSGRVERAVRVLVGSQLAAGYFYMRNVSTPWSYALLTAGVGLLAAAVWGWGPIGRRLRKEIDRKLK